MELIWNYFFEENADINRTDHYENALFADGGHLFHIADSGNGRIAVHVLSKESGMGQCQEISLPQPMRSLDALTAKECFFVGYHGKVFLSAGEIYLYESDRFVQVSNTGTIAERSHLVEGGMLYALVRTEAGSSRYRLYCFDLARTQMKWSRDIPHASPYSAGELCFFENRLVCSADKKLLFLDPLTGAVLEEICIPRINKLYHPIRMDENSLLIGYTNWMAAGVLNYDTAAKRVAWKNSVKFEGPELRYFTGLWQHIALWTKNDTELIAADIRDGSTLYRIRTKPWLYTRPCLMDGKILYGTSGAGGAIHCANLSDGKERWSVFLKKGCEFYGLDHSSVIVGDAEGVLRKIGISNGETSDSLSLGSAVVGRITVDGGFVYTVVMDAAEQSCKCRIVKVKT